MSSPVPRISSDPQPPDHSGHSQPRPSSWRTRTRPHRALGLAVVCLTALSLSLTSMPAATASAPPDSDTSRIGTLTTLSRIVPSRLVQSTGNLYWTNNVVPSGGIGFARVYRMSKVGTPGTERLLYQEAHNGSRFFNAITYAKIGTSFFGYFVVNNSATHTSVIKRVPLAGGAASTIVTSPRYISTRDLVTDGLTLYWADEGGLRRSPIGGGGVTTLFSATSLLSVGLDASRVYFSSGTQVRSIAKFGGLSTLVASGTSVVAALNVQRTTPTSIFWAERNGSVRGRFVGGFGVTYQEPSTTGRRAYERVRHRLTDFLDRLRLYP